MLLFTINDSTIDKWSQKLAQSLENQNDAVLNILFSILVDELKSYNE